MEEHRKRMPNYRHTTTTEFQRWSVVVVLFWFHNITRFIAATKLQSETEEKI
jgi:hypothetical protein